jgi:hypothetical protein
MSGLDALAQLASGKRPDADLLPACRLEAFGAEFFGEEAIVQAFRQAPVRFTTEAVAVQTERQVAVFERDMALIVDVYGSHIARVWRLGPGDPGVAEPSIGVPFDPDLMQSRGDLAFRAEDHPLLAPSQAVRLAEAGQRLARDWTEDDGAVHHRVRTFLLRAFSNSTSTAGLFAVHRLGGGAARAVGFSYAAILLSHQAGVEPLIVQDQAGQAACEAARWTPRIEELVSANYP